MFAFGDSFDLYSVVADMILGYWDSGTLPTLQAVGSGRFPGSRCIGETSGGSLFLVKSSGQNDSVHHIVCAFNQSATLSGTLIGFNFQLQDGGTTQCSIVFRSDGAIVLQSGAAGGTTLATYTGAVSAQNTWFAFEIEVVISGTVGSMTVRKNGNTSNDFTLGSLNTRTTSNNYANRIAISGFNSVSQLIDDFLWRSDPTSVPWVGDIRCFPRMPNADVSVQFTGNPYSFYAYGDSTISYNTYNVIAANQIMFMPFTVSSNMVNPVNAIIMDWFFGYTGTTNVAIYDSTGTGGSPGNLIASSTPATNPTPRPWTFTFASPPTLTAGVRYYLAQSVNASCQWAASSALSGVTGYTLSYTYSGSFPSSAAGAASFSAISPYFLYTAHAQHWMYVSEAQQDGLTTYVFDNTVGHADFYGIGPISITPTSTICVTTRGFMQKSDAGFRQGAVQMKSGSTTVVSPTLNLSTGFGYAYRTDLTDPATGSAWTATAVNAIQIGPTVIS